MKFFIPQSILAVTLIALLPFPARTQSPVTPMPDDPIAALQVLQKANDDLLKRQDDSLKALTDLTATANEVRLFSRRG